MQNLVPHQKWSPLPKSTGFFSKTWSTITPHFINLLKISNYVPKARAKYSSLLAKCIANMLELHLFFALFPFSCIRMKLLMSRPRPPSVTMTLSVQIIVWRCPHMCINHDVVSDTMLYLTRLYTSDKNCNNLWMYTYMYQQFISDDTSTRSIIKKHNKQNSM